MDFPRSGEQVEGSAVLKRLDMVLVLTDSVLLALLKEWDCSGMLP